MAVMLPPEASKLLNELGFEWPEGNEDKVFSYAQQWMAAAPKFSEIHQQGTEAANSAVTTGTGPAIEAFKTSYTKADGVQDVAQNFAVGSSVAGGVLVLVAGAIVALKIAFVVNLVTTVIEIIEAIAAAIPTCGVSLAWIPAAKIICQKLLEMAINFGVNKLMGA